MNFKIRSKEEIELSVKNGDFTGGYEFLPWLLRMRPFFSIFVIIIIALMLIYAIIEKEYLIGLIPFGLFIIILALMKREYNLDKKGIAR